MSPEDPSVAAPSWRAPSRKENLHLPATPESDQPNARIPAALHPLIQDYVGQINAELPGLVTAFYLVGSIALGDFVRGSDVDFVAVLARQATPDDMTTLRAIHERIAHQYPAWQMEGRYWQPDALGGVDDADSPFPKYFEGKLAWSTNSTLHAVTWWILQHHGIAVFGPPPQMLVYTVDMGHLLREQRANLNSYWATWTRRPKRLAMLLSDWGVQWAVLGVLRQFYTFHEQRITSKTQAGEYALGRLPARWHRIIQEAIALRNGLDRRYYRSRLARASDAVHLLRFVIRSCNERFGAL